VCIVCPILPPIDNGNVIPPSVLTNVSEIGTMAFYSCDDGFFLNTEIGVSECVLSNDGPIWTLGDGPICLLGNIQ